MGKVLGIVSDLQHKKEIMVRLPAAMARFMDGFIVGNYGSRPEALIDADRKFIFFIEIIERGILSRIRDRDVSAEVKQKYYLEEIEAQIRPYKARYDKFVKDSGNNKEVQVMVKCPNKLVDSIDKVVERTQCFRNYHDFTKIAFAYLIEENSVYQEHESEMAAFLKMKETNLDEEVRRLREELNK